MSSLMFILAFCKCLCVLEMPVNCFSPVPLPRRRACVSLEQWRGCMDIFKSNSSVYYCSFPVLSLADVSVCLELIQVFILFVP